MALKAEHWPTSEQFAEVARIVGEAGQSFETLGICIGQLATSNQWAATCRWWRGNTGMLSDGARLQSIEDTPRAAMAKLIDRLRAEFGEAG